MPSSNLVRPAGRPGLLDLAAAASAGSALVHAAASGSHADHDSVQLLFAVCAALQLGWAALALTTSRTAVVIAGIVINAGAVGAWALQRTVGLPVVDALADPERVGVQDSMAVVLGTLAALGAAASLRPRLAGRTLPRAWVATGSIFALLLALPAMAVDHDAGHSHGGQADGHDIGHSHSDGQGSEAGDDHGDAPHEHDVEMTAVDADDRCDVGLNTAEFNETTTLVQEAPTHGDHTGVDFTVAEWAEEFADESLGIDAATLADWKSADPFRTETVLGGDLTPSIEPDPWVPVTDPTQCAALAAQLQQARDAAARYPTLADALAAGYVKGSLYAPGQGAHYSRMDLIVDDGFDPAEPELLMYDSQEPDAKLMGVMYYLIAPDGLPENPGFVGSGDMWHAHRALCRDAEGVAVSPSECAEGRGTTTDESYGFMLHAWVVPGCESDWGVFSGGNPALPYLPISEGGLENSAKFPFPVDITLASGCNSGKTVTDPLVFDDSGHGATIR